MKFFNKALVYRLTQPVEQFQSAGPLGESSYLMHERLNELLNARLARCPGPMELTTYGFCEPYPNPYRSLAQLNEDPSLEDDLEPFIPRLVRPINNGEFLVVCAEEQYRSLPGVVVKREVMLKVQEIEHHQCRKVYKKERDQIKDEVVARLLPQAFVMARRTYAIIDTQENLIWVQATSPKPAEAFLSILRECLGSLPVRPVQAKIAPSASFTDWIKKQECPEDFFLLDSALFEDTHEDGGKIGAVRQDLTSDEIKGHVDAGKLVTKVAVAHKKDIGFIVDDRLRFTKMAFADLLRDQAEQDAGGEEADVTALHDASYLIMGRGLRDLFHALLTALGGEEMPQGI